MSNLFDVRNAFYLGNFQQAINEAQKAAPSIEKDVLLYRSYIALKKYNLVLSEINASSAPPALKAVRQFSEYLANSSKRKQIVDELDAKYFCTEEDPVILLMAAIIYFTDKNYESTLRVLHFNASNDLECLALQTQTYIVIDRFDLAGKSLKKMQEMDDDSTLTQLTTASLNLSLGNEKLQEAYYIYQELMDKYQETPLLCNGISATMCCTGRIPDTESFLQQALVMNSDQSETLLNLMFLANNEGANPELAERYLNQLKDCSPGHPFLEDLQAKQEAYENLCQMYKC